MALLRLEEGDPRPRLICGDPDLDEFYAVDSIEGCRQLLSVTYIWMQDDKAVGFFSLSNDSIKKEDLSRAGIKHIFSIIPKEKRYKSMPAAKIGRLGIHEDFQSSGIGTDILDFLKAWFTQGNKTGCRFLIVDVYNKERVTRFYEKNGFTFLTTKDTGDNTRIMYFDLITFRP